MGSALVWGGSAASRLRLFTTVWVFTTMHLPWSWPLGWGWHACPPAACTLHAVSAEILHLLLATMPQPLLSGSCTHHCRCPMLLLGPCLLGQRVVRGTWAPRAATWKAGKVPSSQIPEQQGLGLPPPGIDPDLTNSGTVGLYQVIYNPGFQYSGIT